MSSKLVIVESPAKAKTIEKYLPDGYRVLASKGHVRDLPDSASQVPDEFRGEEWANLGVNIERDFDPIYVIKDERSREAIAELEEALADADELILATDEDREGEAISWHLYEQLAPKVPTKRMVFNEITKTAIQEALASTREIDMHLVAAQEARRILDRLVGYPLSMLVKHKINYKLSAGRVQSAAVRMLVERERERRRFRAGSYWDLNAGLEQHDEAFEAALHSIDGTRLASGKDFDKDTGKIAEGRDVLLLDEQQARDLQERLEGASFTLDEIHERQYSTSPKPPFTTSTLQQEASRKLGMSAKQTMGVAQKLYENGLITYMRTDSTNLSKQAIGAARSAARELYGDDYVASEARAYSKKSKGAQEAHEAIRPSGDDFMHPEKSKLRGAELRLYRLIWERTVACQMSDARRTSIRYDLVVELDDKKHLFRANGNRIDFPGYIRVYFEGSDDPEAALEDVERLLPEADEGDTIECASIEAVGHETRPPSRYTEASLVRALEEAGVGRPSTYATIMGKITTDDRYAIKEGRTLVPTYMAFAVTRLLERYFPELVESEFTSRMEDDLDEIAAGKASKVDYLHRFYRDEDAFADKIERYEDEIDPGEARVIDLEDFPALLRVGRYGPYVELEVEDERKTVDVPSGVAPADLSIEQVQEALARLEAGPIELGDHPESGEMIYLKNGPYGPYVQLGPDPEDKEGPKPKRASLPKGVEEESVSFEDAVRLLSLPIELGEHPETGSTVQAGLGRYGPYVRHKKDYRSVDNFEKLFEITLEEAVEIFKQPKRRNRKVLREMGEHPETGKEMNILDGRYGPYIKMGRTNASLPSGENVDDITIERAVELLAEKQAKKGKKKKTKKKSKKKSKKSKKKS